MLITVYQHNAEKRSKFWHAKNINNNNNNKNSFTSFTGHFIGCILLASFCQKSLEEILVEKEKGVITVNRLITCKT